MINMINLLLLLLLLTLPQTTHADDRIREFSVGLGAAKRQKMGSQLNWSPALSVAWDRGIPERTWFLGLDSAPLGEICKAVEEDVIICQEHLLALSGGIAFGSEALRVGPYLTVGVGLIGGGGFRGVMWFSKKPVRLGLEARLSALWPGTWQAMVLWRISHIREPPDRDPAASVAFTSPDLHFSIYRWQ
jgi:hypothetical protein